VRLLYVLQRYGHEVAGGAERHCREFATRLAGAGHDVEVLTSCAINHSTWVNAYPPGDSDVDGVRVHRLPVARTRDERVFASLVNRVLFAPPPALHLQRRWLEEQGPVVPELVPWLVRRAPDYDLVIFFTYLFYPTWAGLPAVAGLVPSVLHPTAHDEAALAVPHFDTVFLQPSAFAFSSEEERDLVQRRFEITQPSAVIGVGVDLAEPATGDAEAAFRRNHALVDRPYLTYVGRVEPGKGAQELFQFFAAYKARNPGPLALVFLGEAVFPLPEHPDVVMAGFVDDVTRHAALGGALALVQPSYFESFSMVLTEAWAARKPTLVQGHCEVLVGQATRAGGGLPYRGFAEFEAAVDLMLGDPGLARAMGESGRRYVEANYDWQAVMDRYERFLAWVAEAVRSPA
jgi:glycosyltransferase involved in cell wall biosynthesis